MKYLIHFFVFVFIGWPALIAGYVWAAIASGWSSGMFMYERHEEAAIKKWLPNKAGPGMQEDGNG